MVHERKDEIVHSEVVIIIDERAKGKESETEMF
jgi:hypothetical protein